MAAQDYIQAETADPIRLLLVEDNLDDVLLFESIIATHGAGAFILESVNTFADAVSRLGHAGIDCIVLDLNLPDSTGTESIGHLTKSMPNVPIVVLTQMEQDTLAIEASRAGAQDYLVKSQLDQGTWVVRVLRQVMVRHELRMKLNKRTKEYETAMRQLTSILQASPDAILVVDDDGIVRFANVAAGICFDKHESDLIGSEFGLPLISESPTEVDILGRSDTEPGIAEMNAIRMWWIDRTGYLVMLHDITHRKQMHFDLKRASSELSEKNQELERFVYTVSHDLKSPLQTVIGFSKNLLKDVEAGKFDRAGFLAERMYSAGQRMRKNIDDLLRLSRIGRFLDTIETTNVVGIVQSVCDEHTQALKDKGVKLEIAPNLPSVSADPRRIEQLFDNLVSNAIKYGCDNENPVIEIGGFAEGGEIHYFVRDNGSGIAPQFHQKIFELFERLKRDADGTGVGLAIVKRVMDVHDGRVWVDSKEGRGATFWMAFPRRRELLKHQVNEDDGNDQNEENGETPESVSNLNEA